MKFDDGFDQNKSQKNQTERGIDFIQARAVWLDENCMTIPAKNVQGEVRFGTVGMIQGKLWVALWTDRDGAIRIFSVHRAEGGFFERAYHENE